MVVCVCLRCSSFDGDHYNKVKEGPIDVDTVVVLDETTGTPINQWGRQLFYMPHGLHIDGQGNTWVTDVALHQVMKVTIVHAYSTAGIQRRKRYRRSKSSASDNLLFVFSQTRRLF